MTPAALHEQAASWRVKTAVNEMTAAIEEVASNANNTRAI